MRNFLIGIIIGIATTWVLTHQSSVVLGMMLACCAFVVTFYVGRISSVKKVVKIELGALPANVVKFAKRTTEKANTP